MGFEKNNTFGTGRPLNSQNKVQSKDSLKDLLNIILDDLTTNYDTLNNSDKVKLLIGYKHFFGIPIDELKFHGIQFDFNGCKD